MPKNISFALTTDAIVMRRKTVTRRLGWKLLKPGDVLNACVKCMGLKPGEKIQRLGAIRVVSVRIERLDQIIDEPNGTEREGFPGMTGEDFVAMFCRHMKCKPNHDVTRIEFEYL